MMTGCSPATAAAAAAPLRGKRLTRGAFAFDLGFLQVISHDLRELEMEFTVEDVWNVVRALPPDLPRFTGYDPYKYRHLASLHELINAHSIFTHKFRTMVAQFQIREPSHNRET